MTPELTALLANAGILLLLLVIQGGLVPATHGLKWGLGPRDEPRDPSVLQGRLNRIVANHIEGMAMFAPLILIAHAAGLASPLTALGAIVFVAGRAAFAIIYMAGVPVLRSAAWGTAMIGLFMVAYDVVRLGVL